MGVSIREYARSRAERGLPGTSHTAVRKAIQTGRITAEPDGTIDPDRADAQWAGQTDPAKQRDLDMQSSAVKSAKAEDAPRPEKAVPQSAIDVVLDTLAETGHEPEFAVDGEPVTFMQARLATEVLKAKLQSERLKRERGEVVDRKLATSLVFDLARRERDGWIGWPSRVSANMAAELGVDAHQLEQVLDKHLREHLAIMAEVKVDLR